MGIFSVGVKGLFWSEFLEYCNSIDKFERILNLQVKQ